MDITAHLEYNSQPSFCDCDAYFGSPYSMWLLWEHLVSVLFDTKVFTVFLSVMIAVCGTIFFGRVGDQNGGWKEKLKISLKSGLVFVLCYLFLVVLYISLWLLGLFPFFSYTPKPESVVCNSIQRGGSNFQYNFIEGLSYVKRGSELDPELRKMLNTCKNRDKECYFFLTGQSGVGKSTFLKKFLEELQTSYLYLNFKFVSIVKTNDYLKNVVGLGVDVPEKEVWNVIRKVLRMCTKTVVVVEDLVRAEDDFVPDRLQIAYDLYKLHEIGLPIIFSSSNPDLLHRLQKTGRLYDLENYFELDVIYDKVFLYGEDYKNLPSKEKLVFARSLDMSGGFFKDLKKTYYHINRKTKGYEMNQIEEIIDKELQILEMEVCKRLLREITMSKEGYSDINDFGYLLFSDLRREAVMENSGKCKYPNPKFINQKNTEYILLKFFRGKYADWNLINQDLGNHCFYFSTRLVGRVLNGDICRREFCDKFSLNDLIRNELCDVGNE